MPRITFALMTVAAALTVAACSSSNKAGVATSSTTARAVVPSSPSNPVAAAKATATTAAPRLTGTSLSGSWSGHYSGAFSGTFLLNWQQSGSTLSGTIDLNPGGTVDIQGTVRGDSIRFGTLGDSVAGMGITYTGSVSGSSMSGSYQIQATNRTMNGSWTASKG